MNKVIEALEERYDKLGKCLVQTREEIKKYPVGSPEFEELFTQLSNINIDLCLLRSKLKEIKRRNSFGDWIMEENKHSIGYKK